MKTYDVWKHEHQDSLGNRGQKKFDDWSMSRTSFSTNHIQYWIKPRLSHPRFPATQAGYLLWPGVLIGSLLYFLCFDWPLWLFDSSFVTFNPLNNGLFNFRRENRLRGHVKQQIREIVAEIWSFWNRGSWYYLKLQAAI